MDKKIFANIAYVLTKTWMYERVVIAFLAVQVISGIVIPLIPIYLSSAIVNGVIHSSQMGHMLSILCGLMIILAISNFANSYISSVYETHIMNNKMHFLTDLFRKKMDANYAFVESGIGQNMFQYALTSLLNDNQGISGMLQSLGTLLASILSIILYAGILVSLDAYVAVILIVISILHFILLNTVLRKQYAKKDSGADFDRKIEYLLKYSRKDSNNKDIKLFFMQDWLSRVYDTLIREKIVWVKELEKYGLYAAIFDIALLVIRDGCAYFFIFRAILHNEIEVSQFVFYFGMITGFSVFVTGLTSGLAHVSQRSREVSAFRDYLEVDGADWGAKTIQLTAEDTLCIEFENVSFRFDTQGSYILKNINLKIHKGEKIALIGENGAGKTTLMKLMCGFYAPTEGHIYINGVDVSEVSRENIESQFAAVFQDTYILPLSVAENIAFSDAQSNQERIHHCIDRAGLEDYFHDLDMPITKVFDPNGVIPSGGQAQKLVLARAIYKMLYKNAAALILDEPTAALDAIAERQFYEKYNSVAAGKTSIFISHRLASTRFCDRIILINSGRIVENGTHDQLIASAGQYKELFDLQSQYYREASANTN